MNVDNFFNNSIDVSKDDYVYGYVHMYYNYNDTSTKNSGVRSYYYSNYIKGTFTDTSLSKVISTNSSLGHGDSKHTIPFP